MTAPRARARASAAALAAFVAGSGLAGAGEASAEAEPTRMPKAIFVSSHSLIDRPIPDDLASLMAGAGHPVTWQRQHRIGSSIAERSSEEGIDRAGRPIAPGPDAIAAAEAPYDTLIVTEQHVLPAILLWNDTARMLRRLHDRLAARDPTGTTYFYVPWMALDDKDDPRGWIAYERAAAPLWTCLAAAAEGGPAAAGRRGRIVPLPAALALSDLIAAATEGAGLPGITQATPRETVDLLVADDVHPTRLGSYYLALVVFSAITGRAAETGSDPAGVPRNQARALEEFVRREAPRWTPGRPDLDRCAAGLRQGAMGELWAYVERAHWRKEHGFLAARWARLRQGAQWRLLLWREPGWNPFRLPD